MGHWAVVGWVEERSPLGVASAQPNTLLGFTMSLRTRYANVQPNLPTIH